MPPGRPEQAAQSVQTTPRQMLWRPSGALNQLEACGIVRRASDGVLDLHLSRDEVAEGGMITISMHVPVRCDRCADAGEVSCAKCQGTKVADALFSAWLTVFAGEADGALLRPSVLLPGMISPVVFRLRTAGP